MCRVLGVPTSGYYAWLNRAPSPRSREDTILAERIRWIRLRSRGTYGAPRAHAEMVDEGIRVGRKRVARLMRAAGDLLGRPALRQVLDHLSAQVAVCQSRTATATLAASVIPPLGRIGQVTSCGSVAAKLPADRSPCCAQAAERSPPEAGRLGRARRSACVPARRDEHKLAYNAILAAALHLQVELAALRTHQSLWYDYLGFFGAVDS